MTALLTVARSRETLYETVPKNMVKSDKRLYDSPIKCKIWKISCLVTIIDYCTGFVVVAVVVPLYPPLRLLQGNLLRKKKKSTNKTFICDQKLKKVNCRKDSPTLGLSFDKIHPGKNHILCRQSHRSPYAL